MPDPPPPPGRPAASRNRPRSPEQSDEATGAAAPGRSRRAAAARPSKPAGATERNEPRWRDIQWVDFGDVEQAIDPPPVPQAEPAPATTTTATTATAESDGFGKLLRRFGQPAGGGGRTNISGLASRFARMPVPRLRPAMARGERALRQAQPTPPPIEPEERLSTPTLTAADTRPSPLSANAGLSRTFSRRARRAGPSPVVGFGRRIHAAALRLTGNDPERLRRWLTVAGSVIAVAAVAYAIGAMVAGLMGSNTGRHASSDQPGPQRVQLAAAQPKPPAPAPPPAIAVPPSEPAARAAFYLARAKDGDPVAQYDLGVLYAEGNGLVQDYASAAAWFHAAAAQGNLDAEYNLGVLYERGLGVTASAIDAVNWYRSAADQNHARAQYNLAIAYAEGRCTEQDLAAAARWYQRAAQQGLVPAMVNLAILYEQGQGVDRSPADAYAWYSAAGERGDNPAKDRAAELFRQFSDKDKAKAQGLAATVSAAINRAPPA